MKKKKTLVTTTDYCPKDGSPACCVRQRNRPKTNWSFDEIDSTVQDAWDEFSVLEPSVKDIKKVFVQRLLMHYLMQCARIGLSKKEIKAIFDKELEMHDDRVKKFLEVSRKLKNEKSGYAE